MNFSEREIIIQGQITPNTSLNVTVNGVACNTVLKDQTIFSFVTDVTVHGKIPITIEVISGSVSIDKTVVKYPAIVNGKIGSLLFDMPIKDPMVIIEKDKITHLTKITLSTGKSISFDHLIINGPNFWNIISSSTETDLYTQYINDPVANITSLTPVWLYSPLSPSHKDNVATIALMKFLNLSP